MVLVLAPPSVLRLLRSEQRLTLSEAAVIRWLTEVLPVVEAQPGDTSHPPPHEFSGPNLRLCLPSLVAQAAMSGELGSPYNLFEPPRGCTISSLDTPLTRRQRQSVDGQAGIFIRLLSRLSPKSTKFGPAVAVLAHPASSRPTNMAHVTEATDRWSVAFHSLLEGILRDGEDMTVVLAYSTIRRHFRRLGHILDSVTSPRLVVIDAAEDSNLLITRLPPVPEAVATPEPEHTSEEQGATSTSTDGSERTAASGEHPDRDRIAVTGLRDWSHCVFGDPLFALVFCAEPSAAFLDAFYRADQGVGVSSLIEDEELAHVRILLYQCYHAASQIVKEFYRPTIESSKRELAARKKLSEVLASLDEVEDDPKRRHRRPSGEMSPAKKPRSGGDGDDIHLASAEKVLEEAEQGREDEKTSRDKV